MKNIFFCLSLFYHCQKYDFVELGKIDRGKKAMEKGSSLCTPDLPPYLTTNIRAFMLVLLYKRMEHSTCTNGIVEFPEKKEYLFLMACYLELIT